MRPNSADGKRDVVVRAHKAAPNWDKPKKESQHLAKRKKKAKKATKKATRKGRKKA